MFCRYSLHSTVNLSQSFVKKATPCRIKSLTIKVTLRLVVLLLRVIPVPTSLVAMGGPLFKPHLSLAPNNCDSVSDELCINNSNVCFCACLRACVVGVCVCMCELVCACM